MNPYQGTVKSSATAHPPANWPQVIRDLRRAHKPKTAPAPTKNRAGILVPAAMAKSAEASNHQWSGEWETGRRGDGETGRRGDVSSPFPPISPSPRLSVS